LVCAGNNTNNSGVPFASPLLRISKPLVFEWSLIVQLSVACMTAILLSGFLLLLLVTSCKYKQYNIKSIKIYLCIRNFKELHEYKLLDVIRLFSMRCACLSVSARAMLSSEEDRDTAK
jgi:hypothetical protein